MDRHILIGGCRCIRYPPQSKCRMPIHYDTDEDGQNKKSRQKTKQNKTKPKPINAARETRCTFAVDILNHVHAHWIRIFVSYVLIWVIWSDVNFLMIITKSRYWNHMKTNICITHALIRLYKYTYFAGFFSKENKFRYINDVIYDMYTLYIDRPLQEIEKICLRATSYR